MASDWTQDTTVSPSANITISYIPFGSKTTKKQKLPSTQRTETTTVYQTFEYQDESGQPQKEDAAVSQVSLTSATIADVAQAYVAARLTQGLSLPSSGVNKQKVKLSEYTVSTEGVKLVKEREEVWISQYELAGGLDVPWLINATKATDGLIWEPSNRQVLSTVTETVYEEAVIPAPYQNAPGKPYTRTKVSRWSCRGQTQEGKEAFKALVALMTDGADVAELVEQMEELVFDGTEISTSIGRTPVLSRPSGQEIDALQVEEAAGDRPVSAYDAENDFGSGSYASWSDYAQPGFGVAAGAEDWVSLVPTWEFYASSGVPSDTEDGWSGSVSHGDPPWAQFVPEGEDWRDYDVDSNNDGIPDWAELVPPPGFYDADSNGDGIPDWAEFVPDGSSRARTYVTATYEMPYGPDAFVAYDTAELSLIPSGAGEAMRRYGEIENMLRTGHALGANVTSEAKALPTKPLAPVYVNAEGLVAGFLMNGVSWAFDGNGIVVSADLLLMGVAGLDPSVEEAQAWVQLPAGTGGLQNLDLDPDIGSLTPANTITMPEGLPEADRYRVFRWLPRDGEDVLGPSLEPDQALLPPFIQRFRMVGRSRSRAQLTEYPFRLNTTEELVGRVRTIGGMDLATGIAVPAAAISVAAYAPVVEAAEATLVVVPAAAIIVAGVAPEEAGAPRTRVTVPAAGLSISAVAPAVSSGASVGPSAAGITVSGLAPTVGNGTAMDASTLLYLPLDSSLADLSNSANTVTIATGSGAITTAQKKYGAGSLNLPGSSYARISGGLSLTGDFTVECWFRAPDLSINMCLFGNTTGNHQVLRFNGISSGTIGSYSSAAGYFQNGASLSGLAVNTWHHVAMVRSGTTIKVYLNGALASTDTVSVFTLLIDTIGAGYGGFEGPWVGQLDDIRISSVARYLAAFTPTGPFL